MILHLNQTEFIDTLKPIDLSIELKAQAQSLKAWGQGDPKIEPVRDENFVGSVAEGGVVNFKNIFFNPHALSINGSLNASTCPEAFQVFGCINMDASRPTMFW